MAVRRAQQLRSSAGRNDCRPAGRLHHPVGRRSGLCHPKSSGGRIPQGQAERFQPAAALPLHDLAEAAFTAQGRRGLYDPLRGREHLSGDRDLRPQAPPDAQSGRACDPDRLPARRPVQAGLSLLLDGRGQGRQARQLHAEGGPVRAAGCRGQDRVLRQGRVGQGRWRRRTNLHPREARLHQIGRVSPGFQCFQRARPVPRVRSRHRNQRAAAHRGRRVGGAVPGGDAGHSLAASGDRSRAARLRLHAQTRASSRRWRGVLSVGHPAPGGGGRRAREAHDRTGERRSDETHPGCAGAAIRTPETGTRPATI